MELQCHPDRAEPLVSDHITELARVICSHVRGEDKPGTDDDLQLFRLYAVLARAKGDAVTAEDVHDAWCAWMYDRDPNHEALIPFGELTSEQRALDDPLVAAIRAAATS